MIYLIELNAKLFIVAAKDNFHSNRNSKQIHWTLDEAHEQKRDKKITENKIAFIHWIDVVEDKKLHANGEATVLDNRRGRNQLRLISFTVTETMMNYIWLISWCDSINLWISRVFSFHFYLCTPFNRLHRYLTTRNSQRLTIKNICFKWWNDHFDLR